jgi:hypothetical protein
LTASASPSVVGAPSTAASPAAVSSSTPNSSATCPSPSTSQAAQVSPPAFPFSVWENDPFGVNLRSSASLTGAKIGGISQGTKAEADQRVLDDTGSAWYHLTLGSQAGWARADFFVTTPSHVAAAPHVGLTPGGWSLMTPDRYHLIRWGAAESTLQTSIDVWPAFLIVETGAPGDAFRSAQGLAGSALRSLTREFPAWREISSKPIQVWSLSATEQTASVNGCDGPWVTYITVKSPVQAPPCQGGCTYQFLFVSTQADDPVVNQVIASITLDQKVQAVG